MLKIVVVTHLASVFASLLVSGTEHRVEDLLRLVRGLGPAVTVRHDGDPHLLERVGRLPRLEGPAPAGHDARRVHEVVV